MPPQWPFVAAIVKARSGRRLISIPASHPHDHSPPRILTNASTSFPLVSQQRPFVAALLRCLLYDLFIQGLDRLAEGFVFGG